MSKHTPGPWIVAEQAHEDGGLRVFSLSDAVIVPAQAFGDTAEQRGANAALIKAAANACMEVNPENPIAAAEALQDLLDVCKRLCDPPWPTSASYEMFLAVIRDAYAAVCKAKRKE